MKSSLLYRYNISPHPLLVAVAAVAAGFLNASLHLVNYDILGLPFFFDMIGTFVITIFFGLIPGLLTAVTTHGFLDLLRWFSVSTMPWAPISVASSLLIWVLFKNRKFETILHAIAATVYITFLNALLGAITAIILNSGITTHPVDILVKGFLSIGQSLIASAFWARIPINFIDKGIAVFITFISMKLFIAKRKGPA